MQAVRRGDVVYLGGGLSHHDSFDPKPDAPDDIRGKYGLIDTTVPGLRISDKLPLTSKVMNKIALVRSMNHQMRSHDSAAAETLTGRTPVGGDRETFPDNPHTILDQAVGIVPPSMT